MQSAQFKGRQLNAGSSAQCRGALVFSFGWRLPWSVCTTVACPDVCGNFLRTFSAGLCPRFAQVIFSMPWFDSGIAQGRVLSPSLSNVLVDTSAASVRSVALVVQLVPSDAFRHACHLHGDEVVLVSESQVDLQAGLNACHAWCIRSRFTFGIGPTKSAVMIFGPAWSRPDCHVHLGGVPLPVVTE